MKQIEGFENYFITEDGKLWSNYFCKFITPYISKKGYYCVKLHQHGKRLSTTIHRLVAISYIDNPENKSQVNHINGDKLDNRIENLEWVTSSENQYHAYKTGLKKPCLHENFYRGIIVLDTNTGIFYESIREAAQAFGLNRGTLKDYLRGKRKNKTSMVIA